jgi:hypothetical protein
MVTRKLSCASNGVQEWHELYVAALFETDQQKLPSRIAEAERALRMSADDLCGPQSGLPTIRNSRPHCSSGR